MLFGYLKYQYSFPKLENKSNFFDTKYEVIKYIDDIKKNVNDIVAEFDIFDKFDNHSVIARQSLLFVDLKLT